MVFSLERSREKNVRMVMARTFGLALCILVCITPCLVNTLERRRYDNFHVYQLEPHNDGELLFLQSLDGQRDSFVFLNALNYINSKINVLVAPGRVEDFEMKLTELGMHYELLERNAQAQLEDDEVADPKRRDNIYNWKQYHELNDTYEWLRSLAKLYPEQVSLFVAGKSYEGRELLGIKISYGTEKKAVFLEGGMHAREWISPATTTYIANQLLTSKEKDIRMIAENFDWYILPHANPDGYVYTHTTDRLWRKTRSPQKDGCFGVDPNRNWDFHWNEVGSSDNPCSDTFGGPEAFSEIETRTLADFISMLKGKIFLYVSFHSYSQLLLFPYGHTSELPPNYADLKRVFDAALSGISKRYGTKYTGGNIYDAIYPASGASVDWAYGVADVKYSYCYELRPSSLSFWIGFKLPAAQIIPTGEETLDSLIAMVKESGIKRSG